MWVSRCRVAALSVSLVTAQLAAQNDKRFERAREMLAEDGLVELWVARGEQREDRVGLKPAQREQKGELRRGVHPVQIIDHDHHGARCQAPTDQIEESGSHDLWFGGPVHARVERVQRGTTGLIDFVSLLSRYK